MDDRLPEPPKTWVDVQPGAGQEPSPRGHLQWSAEGDPISGTDVRRTPGYEHLIITDLRPERPA